MLKPPLRLVSRVLTRPTSRTSPSCRFSTSRLTSTQVTPPPPLRKSGFDAPPQGAKPGKPKASPHNVIALSLFLLTGGALYMYFRLEKEKVELRKKAELATSSVGKVKIGGPFNLVNVQTEKRFTERDLLGKFTLVYFGFTNCPDICPEELDKMSIVVDRLNGEFGKDSVVPIFVTVDPARDTSPIVMKYLDDFHPTMIGLSGTYEEIKSMCKTYRVYFSTPPNIKPGDDYLVDHSIFFYLMSPNGVFVDAFGKIFTKDEVTEKCRIYLQEWKDGKRLGEDDQ